MPPEHTLPGDWSALVVFVAGTAWDGNMFPDQHMATRLARHVPVLYVDPPVSVLSPRHNPDLRASLEAPRLRLVAPNLARLTPVVLPALGRPGVRMVAERMLLRAVRRAVRALGAEVDAVVVASQTPAFGMFGERQSVFYATDDLVAAARLIGSSTRWLERCERRIEHSADTVVVVSDGLRERWAERHHDVALIPNGCDVELFAGADDLDFPADVSLPPPIAGFVGHLSERIDVSVLEAVAATGRSLLLVGPRQITFDLGRVEGVLARPNVQWLGARPFVSLPGYLRAIDVGLVPYADSAFNRASFPLKTLEYLAAGRPVVATDLPAIRWLGTDLVRTVAGAAAFAAAVDDELDRPRDPLLAAARRDLAAQHSWDTRAREFLGVLHRAPDAERR